jgi:hypothetical protein
MKKYWALTMTKTTKKISLKVHPNQQRKIDPKVRLKKGRKTGAPQKQITTMRMSLKPRPMPWKKRRRRDGCNRNNCKT